MRFLAPIILALVPGLALACEKFQAIEPEQLKADFALLRSNDTDPVDRIVAFSTLVCSDKMAVRSRAIQDGLQASPDIQAEALFRALSANNSVTITLLDVEGLTDAHYEIIRSTPMSAEAVRFRDPTTACISIYYKERCDGEYQFSVNGNTVQYRNRNIQRHGVFSLNEDGLTGDVTYIIDGVPLTFPARIELF